WISTRHFSRRRRFQNRRYASSVTSPSTKARNDLRRRSVLSLRVGAATIRRDRGRPAPQSPSADAARRLAYLRSALQDTGVQWPLLGAAPDRQASARRLPLRRSSP